MQVKGQGSESHRHAVKKFTMEASPIEDSVIFTMEASPIEYSII